jgi:excisionase family DNA binding protein
VINLSSDKPFLTVKEVAIILRVSPENIRDRIKAGAIRAKKLPGTKSYLISRDEISRLLEDPKPRFGSMSDFIMYTKALTKRGRPRKVVA